MPLLWALETGAVGGMGKLGSSMEGDVGANFDLLLLALYMGGA